MAWQGIIGHDEMVARFRRALERGRLASSFLFVGEPGIGKRSFALKLAQALLCTARPEALLDPCGRCPSCRQVLSGTHPDLTVIARPEGKSEIPVELLIGDKEHRRREGLIHDISLKPLMGGRKVAIIDDADYLNAAGANSLLKTLEEPPPRSVLIVIGGSAARQLPTIRSRCQLVAFQPLATAEVAALLQAQGLVDDAAAAEQLARHSGGSLQQALELADPAYWSFRDQLLQQLAAPDLDSFALAQQVQEFVDAAGKEASARRARLRHVLDFAIEFYRCQMRVACDAPGGDDTALCRLARGAVAAAPVAGGELLRRLDRSTEAAAQIDRNAHQATLIEAWLDSLAAG